MTSTTHALSDECDVRVPMDDQMNVAEMDNDNNNEEDDDERSGEYDGMDNWGEDSDEEESVNEEDDEMVLLFYQRRRKHLWMHYQFESKA